MNDNIMLLPIHQDPADLVLTVIAGKLDSPLTILKRDSLKVGAWTLNFHIIGESHLVTIEHRGKTMLCELLACTDVTATPRLHSHHFSDLTSHCFTQPGYSIAVDINDCPDELAAVKDAGKLEMVFPDVARQTPLTRIVWERVGESAIRWHTLHLYPHEDNLVCVHSLSYFDTLNYNRTS